MLMIALLFFIDFLLYLCGYNSLKHNRYEK